ncbi:MAG TPA: enolase C-terminal domain-like protein [Vicinamibacterales bacterium]|nr:enolase C-terminal domain-like protein [Vicinamibacterales bacterium]
MSSSNPVVRQLRVRAVRVPMPEPHQTASGIVSESPLVLADLTVDGGAIGRSIVFTYTAAALKPTADLMENMGPLIVGQPLAPAELAHRLAARFRLLGTQGLVGMALAGIDMALWDALARVHGVPLVSLLGGVATPVRAYGAIGYDGPARCAEVAESWATRGFTAVKAKIGYPTVAEDVAVIRAIRSAAGDGVAIMVDYNQSLTPADAVRRLSVLDHERLEWVEEPTMAHDYSGHALIAREARTPIQCGENWWGVRDMQHAIAAGASDYVMLDAMKIGGVTGWLAGAALADAHGIRVSTHLWPEVSAHLLSVTPTAHWLEYADWWNPILREPLQVIDGMARPSSTVGCGMEWDETAVGRFLA